uniref:(northern house mosquito) hypothetical protein n=1 Tax=Culex pipiens TaxID=7175 RepID=A0A8D8FRD6_CULPI
MSYFCRLVFACSMLLITAAVLMMGKSFHHDYILWLECVRSSHKKKNKKNISSENFKRKQRSVSDGRKIARRKNFSLCLSLQILICSPLVPFLCAFSCFVNLSCCRFARFASLLVSCSLDLNFSAEFLTLPV